MDSRKKAHLLELHLETVDQRTRAGVESAAVTLTRMFEQKMARRSGLGVKGMRELIYELGRHMNRCEAEGKLLQ